MMIILSNLTKALNTTEKVERKMDIIQDLKSLDIEV